MKDRILDAAERLLIRGGVDAIRLDAVAAEAEVSKGGLLHHFRSRNALVEGVVLRLVERFEAQLPPPGSPPGAFTRAWLEATVPATATTAPDASEQPTVTLLAAVAGGPVVLEVLRQRYRGWQERIEADGLDPATATLVRLAVDGWWLARLLDLSPPDGDLHAAVWARLAALTAGPTRERP